MSTQPSYAKIRAYLTSHADEIQKEATKEHKELLGGEVFRTEYLQKYQKKHVEIIHLLAEHLLTSDSDKSSEVFRSFGEQLAKNSVNDNLTIQETTDGIIFLKQIIWEKLNHEGLLHQLSTQELFKLMQSSGTFIDILVSKVAFTYHQHYSQRKDSSERQKDEFISIVSHELKTPVTSIKAFAQLLEKRFAKAGDHNSAELLSKMNAQLDKLNGLIGDLLDISKIDTNKLQFTFKEFNYIELVEEITEEMQRTTRKHKLRKELSDSKIICADRNRVGQVLTNLISNAIKYSPHGKEIIIRTTTTAENVQVSIQDFGIGVPQKDHQKVFERFYRVEGQSQETFAGMGLGLYICKEIIVRHHGQIWLEGEPGKGSTFHFTLPIISPHQPSQTIDEEEIKHE